MEEKPRCDINAVLKQFGKGRNEAVRQYEFFVLDGIGEGHSEEYYQLRDGLILGDEEFAVETLTKCESAMAHRYRALELEIANDINLRKKLQRIRSILVSAKTTKLK